MKAVLETPKILWNCCIDDDDKKRGKNFEDIVCQVYLADRPEREQIMPTEGEMESMAAKWLGLEFSNKKIFYTDSDIVFNVHSFPGEYGHRFKACQTPQGRAAIWNEWVEEFIAEKEGRLNDPRCECYWRKSSHAKDSPFRGMLIPKSDLPCGNFTELSV